MKACSCRSTQVLRSNEAAAMIRSLFLSMQELNKGARRPANVPPTKVKKLAVIGAGFMGASVGYVSARAGIDVVLIDRDQESADKGKGHAQSVIDDLIKKGRAKESDRDAIMGRISATADYNVLKDCDLVIEAVFEDRKVKADTYAKAQPLLKDGAIIASNTSTLPINSLAEEFKDQGKFIGIHFFSPVEKMMLVEIIVGKNTGDAALATALDYTRAIGKTPIVVNDSRGFYANRCVGRYISEGNEMFLEGVPPAMIENCAKMAGMPVGPLSLSDEVALDLGLKVIKATEADLGPNAVNPDQKKLMVELVEKQNRLGRKNGKGFYDYPEKGKGQKTLWPGLADLQPKKLDPDTLSVEELKQRFLVVQAVEAARTVEDHVITDMREADVGSILGFGFAPFTGGTLSYIDFMGTKKFVDLCHKLEAKYGSRFTPPKLLVEMAAKGETFSRGAGTHTPRPHDEALKAATFRDNHSRWLWVPAFAGTTGDGCVTENKKRGRIIDPAPFRIRNNESLRRLHQAFLDEGFLHLRAGADAGLVGHQVRHFRQVELHPLGPGQHREHVAVGHGKLLAHQIVVPGQFAVDIPELTHHAVLEERLGVVGEHGAELRANVLVQFAVDIGEPCLQLVTLVAVARGRQALAGLVGDHLDDDRAFGDEFAGVERQCRHLALRIDRQVVVAVFQLLGAQVDLDQVIGQTGLQQRDMGGERAGAGRIIQFHRIFLPSKFKDCGF